MSLSAAAPGGAAPPTVFEQATSAYLTFCTYPGAGFFLYTASTFLIAYFFLSITKPPKIKTKAP